MQISKQVALFPVIQLEKLIDLYQKLFPSPGYHVSANDLVQFRQVIESGLRAKAGVHPPIFRNRINQEKVKDLLDRISG